MPAMLGCSTICPNCKHQFQCCTPAPPCCSSRRSVHVLSGGGVVTALSPCPSPQVSPSVPLVFVLPPPFVAAPQPPPEAKPEAELARLADTVKALRLSGWYYEGLTYEKSDELLKDTKVGTFLVRNSSDPRFLFSLSVQTERGPKSVRLFYINGYFRLDAQTHLQASMPLFPGVVELIQYYVRRKRSGAQVWVDPQGKCLSPIFLDQPLRKEGRPPTLKHLARLTINWVLKETSTPLLELELPTSLSAYLAEYPYSL